MIGNTNTNYPQGQDDGGATCGYETVLTLYVNKKAIFTIGSLKDIYMSVDCLISGSSSNICALKLKCF